MASNNLPGKLYLQDVGEDNLGAYLKVLVLVNNEQNLIRWGLDSYTYKNLQNLLLEIPLYAKEHLILLLTIDVDSSLGYMGSIQIKDKAEHHLMRQFACSELFVSNLNWILSVRQSEQLEALLWKQSEDYQDKSKIDQEKQPIEGQLRKHKRSWIAKFTMAGAIILAATLCSAEIFHYRKVTADTSFTQAHEDLNSLANEKLVAAISESQVPFTNEELKTVQLSKKSNPAASTETNIPLDISNSVTVQNSSNEKVAEKSICTDQLHAPIIYSVEEGEVALTFDDGPSPYTNDIVSILSNYHVNATFFFIGNRVSQWTDAVKNAVSHGNSIGNHSESHPLLTQLSNDEQKQQIIHGANDIQASIGEKVTLFRPPYGSYNQVTENVLKEQHMVLAMWNRDPRDWAAKSAVQITDAVIHNHPSGGIFDLHEDKLTVAALPTIIENLQQQGLKLVVLHIPNG